MINLREVYGKRYKIGIDPSWDAETPENRTWCRQHGEELYYYELLGKHGQLYNHSDTHLQMWIKPRLGSRLYRAIPPGWRVHQNASDGYAFVLPNSDIGLAFKWIKPRKKRIGRNDPKTLEHLRQIRLARKIQP